jgi:hypothetical protein
MYCTTKHEGIKTIKSQFFKYKFQTKISLIVLKSKGLAVCVTRFDCTEAVQVCRFICLLFVTK